MCNNRIGMEYLREFLENLLKKEGLDVNLPNVVNGSSQKGRNEVRAEEIAVLMKLSTRIRRVNEKQ